MAKIQMNFAWVIVPKRTGDGSPPLIAVKRLLTGPRPERKKIPMKVTITVIRVVVMIPCFHL